MSDELVAASGGDWSKAPHDPSGYPDPGRPGRCARCGTVTEERDRGGRLRPTCPNCGWV